MKTLVLLVLVLMSLSMRTVEPAKIVVTYLVGTKSQLISFMPIVEELAHRGHDITVVTAYKVPITDKSIGLIHLADLDAELEVFTPDWFGMSNEGAKQILTMATSMKSMYFSGYECLMRNKEFQSLIKANDIDLFIVDSVLNEFVLPIVDNLKVPFVLHSAAAGYCLSLQPMGVSMDYAAVPTSLTEFDDRMSFTERFTNAVQSEVLKLFIDWYIFRPLEERIRMDMPVNKPLLELKEGASLLIENSHAATDWPRYLPPTVVRIGSLQTRPAKKLPEHLKTFADEADKGFILLTLGSLIKVSSMPEKTLQAFMDAFSKLPQKVICKWEAEIPKNIPSNILLVDWLPQQDLLGHKNAKVFITHGGLIGFQEAVYHAVPLLMLPFGNDQVSNAAKARREGFGLKLDWKDVDEPNISGALNQLIENPSFKGNATRLSKLMRDELMPAKEIGAYWIEHVLRHNGTQHFQLAGKDMPFYQRYLFDVVLAIVAIILGFVIAIFALLRCIITKFVFPSTGPKRKTN